MRAKQIEQTTSKSISYIAPKLLCGFYDVTIVSKDPLAIVMLKL